MSLSPLSHKADTPASKKHARKAIAKTENNHARHRRCEIVKKDTERGWRVFLGSFVLLIVSYLIYFVRFPMWQSFVSVQVINTIEILSSFIILLAALILLKKDSNKSLSAVFANKGNLMILVGLGFGLL